MSFPRLFLYASHFGRIPNVYTNSSFPNNSALFANQVIKLYTQSIGSRSYWIISIAGFSIMFGTCIAVFDGMLDQQMNA